jgi:hypothetical protein
VGAKIRLTVVLRDATSTARIPFDWNTLPVLGRLAQPTGGPSSVVEDRLELLARRDPRVAAYVRGFERGQIDRSPASVNAALSEYFNEGHRSRLAGDLQATSARAVTSAKTRRRRSNKHIAFDYFVRRGFTKRQAAGIVGNLWHESGVNPRSRQIGGGPGRGIAQWSVGDRWDTLKRWARRRGKNPRSLRTQLDFIMREFRTTESRAFRGVKRTRTIRDATIAFEQLYERPGIAHTGRRLSLARRAFNRFA